MNGRTVGLGSFLMILVFVGGCSDGGGSNGTNSVDDMLWRQSRRMGREIREQGWSRANDGSVVTRGMLPRDLGGRMGRR